MKNLLNTYYKQISYLFILSLLFSSCKKWTEVQSIKIKKDDIEESNPALYKEYLEDLKKYKSTDHLITIGWFDNSEKNTFNQSQQITKIPDSIDYVILKSSLDLSNNEIEDINNVQQEKGTKFLYEINLDEYINVYSQMSLEEKAKRTLIEHVKENVKLFKNISNKYPYNGVVVTYTARETIHLFDEEKNIEKSIQELFTNTIKEWNNENSTKELLYYGNPETLNDKSILNDTKYIILPTLNSTSKTNLSLILATAIVEDVPTNRFIVAANSTSYKQEEIDKKMGYFLNGDRAIDATTEWLLSDHVSNVKIKGLGIENLQYDYFNIVKTYKYSREAINKMNPSLKK